MFLGTYEHGLDEKQRLTIPAKLRGKISNIVYVFGGIDECLQVRSKESFEELLDELNKKSSMSSKTRLIRRHILGNTSEIEIDSAGRITIPKNILLLANIEKQVYIIGQGDFFEIWNTKIYDEYLNKNKSDIVDIADSLGD